MSQGSRAVCPERISSREEPDRSILNLKHSQQDGAEVRRVKNRRGFPEGDPSLPGGTISGEGGGAQLSGSFCDT